MRTYFGLLPNLLCRRGDDNELRYGAAAWAILHPGLARCNSLADIEPHICFSWLGTMEQRRDVSAKRVEILNLVVAAKAGAKAAAAAPAAKAGAKAGAKAAAGKAGAKAAAAAPAAKAAAAAPAGDS